MKKLILLMLTSMLMVIAGPAWSDSAVQILTCQQDEETSDEQVEAISAEWLKAAKGVKGGENLELHLHFPVAAKAGEVDFLAVLVAPSFSEWGAFTDNYAGSSAEKVDSKHVDAIDCGDGSLWESVKVK
jgi:hypothetical protein